MSDRNERGPIDSFQNVSGPTPAVVERNKRTLFKTLLNHLHPLILRLLGANELAALKYFKRGVKAANNKQNKVAFEYFMKAGRAYEKSGQPRYASNSYNLAVGYGMNSLQKGEALYNRGSSQLAGGARPSNIIIGSAASDLLSASEIYLYFAHNTGNRSCFERAQKISDELRLLLPVLYQDPEARPIIIKIINNRLNLAMETGLLMRSRGISSSEYLTREIGTINNDIAKMSPIQSFPGRIYLYKMEIEELHHRGKYEAAIELAGRILDNATLTAGLRTQINDLRTSSLKKLGIRTLTAPREIRSLFQKRASLARKETPRDPKRSVLKWWKRVK